MKRDTLINKINATIGENDAGIMSAIDQAKKYLDPDVALLEKIAAHDFEGLDGDLMTDMFINSQNAAKAVDKVAKSRIKGIHDNTGMTKSDLSCYIETIYGKEYIADRFDYDNLKSCYEMAINPESSGWSNVKGDYGLGPGILIYFVNMIKTLINAHEYSRLEGIEKFMKDMGIEIKLPTFDPELDEAQIAETNSALDDYFDDQTKIEFYKKKMALAKYASELCGYVGVKDFGDVVGIIQKKDEGKSIDDDKQDEAMLGQMLIEAVKDL